MELVIRKTPSCGQGFIAAFAVLLFLACAPLCRAQDGLKFYEQNYARDVLGKGAPDFKSANPAFDQGLLPGELQEVKEMSGVEDGDKRLLENANGKLQVKKIGAIINGVDQKHLLDALKELNAAAQVNKLPLSSVHVIAAAVVEPLSEPTIKAIGEMMSKGEPLSFSDTIPEGYKVYHSPAWLLSVEGGEVVLDGKGPLSGFLNGKGEFKVESNMLSAFQNNF